MNPILKQIFKAFAAGYFGFVLGSLVIAISNYRNIYFLFFWAWVYAFVIYVRFLEEL